MKKNTGYKVPDQYFETLQERMSELIQEPEKKTKTIRPISIYYAIAASVVLLIVSALTFLPLNIDSSSNTPSLAYDLNDADFYNFEMDDLYYAYNDAEFLEEELDLYEEELADYISEEMNLDELITLSE